MKSIKVRDYMTSNVLTFRKEDNAIEALRRLLKAGRSGGPVIDDEGKVIGMLSEYDCLKEALMDGYYQSGGGDSVADHMTREVEVVKADDDILITSELFLRGRRRIPVIEDGRLVGIISRVDFAKALIKTIDNPRHG